MEAQPLAKKTKVGTDGSDASNISMGQVAGPRAQGESENVAASAQQPAASGDQSVMDAFNRRDMAEVDRAVAAASGSAAETVAADEGEVSDSNQQIGAKRSCTNSKVGEEAVGERVVRRKLNIDNSDGDGPLSDANE